MTESELPTELPNENDPDRSTEQQQSIRDNAEALRILEEAEQSSQRTLGVTSPLTTAIPEAPAIPTDIQDPKRAHNLCYKHIMRMLRKYLKGIPKDANKVIRKEIVWFLNEGETSGRDMRQTYYYLYEQAIAVIQNWVRQYGGNNLTALFIAFRELNDARDARRKVNQSAGDEANEDAA